MGRRSKIEAHTQSEEIIRRLASGDKNPGIVRDFPDIKDDDLDYYRKNKLPQIISKSSKLKELAEQIETADIRRGDTYLQLILGLQKRALDAMETQDPAFDARGWAMISREARGYLELLGKALDGIRDQPQINLAQVNISLNPEWIELKAVIINALVPFPEAREAVIHAVRGR